MCTNTEFSKSSTTRFILLAFPSALLFNYAKHENLATDFIFNQIHINATVYSTYTGHAPLIGYDLLDGHIKSLHANFQVSASLGKKVLIFFSKKNFTSIFQKL